jgi:hypothetical protein
MAPVVARCLLYSLAGSLDKKDTSVGTGVVGAPACGDVMKLQVRVRELIARAARGSAGADMCRRHLRAAFQLPRRVQGWSSAESRLFRLP